MQHIGRRRVRRVAVMAPAAVVLAVLVVAAAGCGGDDGSDGPAPSGYGAPAQSAELTACLEENGITVGSGMPDRDVLERIREVCGDVMPQGGPGAGGGAPPGGLDPSAIADCLRAEGIDVPEGDDPGALMGAIDPSDPDVTAALQACGVGAPGS